MFATANHPSRPSKPPIQAQACTDVTYEHRLARMTQCIVHMLWLPLVLRLAASSVHSFAAMYSNNSRILAQHALIMYLGIPNNVCVTTAGVQVNAKRTGV